jgi:penicillin-binding protein 2
MYLDSDNRPAITPQLAFRVAVIGGFALVMFAIIFFRLWYLQTLSGDKYLADANNNRVREIKVQAPRGKILDREGNVLVDNRPGLVVKVNPDDIPDSDGPRAELYAALAKVLDERPRAISRDVEQQLRIQPFLPATVKQDVSRDAVSYLLEHADDYPGVEVEQVFLREYPHDSIGAHLFGTVGEVTEDQLKDNRYRGVTLGDRVGQSGVEYSYDRFLRGQNGKRRLQVDAAGVRNGEELRRTEAQAGRTLRLGIDLDVQRVGQEALAGSRGAFVVMNAKNGEIVALGSSPSFDPNIFAKIIRERDFKRLSSEENGKPLFNRATQAGYPTGSTFKLVTAVAALEGGLITPDTPLYDGGSLKVGGVTFKNAGGVVHGSVALRQALTVSSDVFFYRLGLAANGKGDGLLIQNWAKRLGIGRLTGIDLPAEGAGLIPTPAWRNELFKKKLTDRPWSVGDNINLSIGQGDLSVTPLQLAVAYATLANGGNVVRPHLGRRIEDADGRVLQEFESPAPRHVDINPAYRQAIMDGLVGAANGPGGTSTAVFQGFNIPIAGKTGTAEKGLGRADQSWYAAITYPEDPQYVVVATDEAGGFGAERAAPIVRQIIAALYDAKDKGPAPGSIGRVAD